MSRLLENSEKLRDTLETRNLYTPNDPYNLKNKRLVDVVNNLASIVAPFSTFDLSNTVIGRVIDPNSPISQIGLIMLAKQFSYTLSSNAIREYMPDINFSNLFDGNPNTKLFTTNIDFQITKKANRSKFGELIENLTGNYRQTSPFNQNSTNYDYIINTGKGQLQFFYDNINKNYYKQSDRFFQSLSKDLGFNLNKISDVLYDKYYFSLSNPALYTNPYTPSGSINLAEIQFREELGDKADEYGSSNEYIDLLGITNSRQQINPNSETESFHSSHGYGLSEYPDNQLFWGGYGKDIFTNDKRFGIDDNDGDIDNSNIEIFNVKKGLLKYTSELLNATESKLIDQSRKKFYDPNNQNRFVGFNGGGLYYPPEDSPFVGKNGIRQHTPFDQYNRYAKAIRFNGNQIYTNGNENSTIHKSVIPKFHPTLNNNSNEVDVRNLMFSIENLAVEVIKDIDNNIAYLNDDSGTVLPISEVGELNGRLMWFPPYDIKLSEQAISRHETTTFLGRSEPIYTWNNSERLATLSFKMLMDYPEQLMSKRGSDTFHEDVSKFFAFGGSFSEKTFNDIGKLNKKLNELKKDKQEILGTEEINRPPLPTATESYFHFPNGEPKQEQETISVSDILSRGYEDNNKTDIEATDSGFNSEFYSEIGVELSDFENKIKDFFGDEEIREYLEIILVGSTTKLFTGDNGANEAEYNRILSERRTKAVREYINETFKKVVEGASKNLEDYGVKFIEKGDGSKDALPINATIENASTDGAKSERQVQIIFGVNGKTNNKTNDLTVDDKKNLIKIQESIDSLTNKINTQKRDISNTSTFNHIFDQLTEDDVIQKGFMSIDRNKFYPAFHTQTPEDFHRRLTFLHQCTRQGKAINNENSTVIVSKNSAFGRQPIQVLRIGDFFHTKIIIDNINFEYSDSTWDINPEGLGVQPMLVDVTMQMRVIGGQSLRAPINALQNAVSFNYYANSTYKNTGTYKTPSSVEDAQESVNKDYLKKRKAPNQEKIIEFRTLNDD